MEVARTALARHFAHAFGELERAIEHCPDVLWEASVWPVRKDDAFVWPIRHAGSKEAGDEELLGVVSAFWNVAYHAIFYLDFYLSRGVTPYSPPKPFRTDEHGANVVPRRTYSKDELLTYATHCRAKIRAVIGGLTEEQAAEPVPKKSNYAGLPFYDLLLVTLRHVQAHAAQLELFLGQHEAVERGAFERRTGLTPRQGRNLLREKVAGQTDATVDTWVESSGGAMQVADILAPGLCELMQPDGAFTVVLSASAPLVFKAAKGVVKSSTKVPAKATATVTLDDRDLLRFLAGELDPLDAADDGTFSIEGDATAVAALRALLA